MEGRKTNYIEYGNNERPMVKLSESDIVSRVSNGYVLVGANGRRDDMRNIVKGSGFRRKAVYGEFGDGVEEVFLLLPLRTDGKKTDCGALHSFGKETEARLGDGSCLSIGKNDGSGFTNDVATFISRMHGGGEMNGEPLVNPRPASYQEAHCRWANGEISDWPKSW